MNPTTSTATRRNDLGGSVEMFDLAMNAAGFIGLQVFPVFEAGEDAGQFPKIKAEFYLKNRETRRAPGAPYSRPSEDDFEVDTYACKEHGTEEVADDREAKMYANYFDYERVLTERGRAIVMNNFERRIADKVFNASSFTPTAVTNEWDDLASATPISDVEAAVQRFFNRTGLWPNALILNRMVYRNLRLVQSVKDNIKNVQSVNPADINIQHMKSAFDLEHILVAGSAKNIAAEGQDLSIAQIWSGEYAAVARIATGPDIRAACIGRTMHWAGDGSKIGTAIESYRDERVRGGVIRVRMDTDEKILHDGCVELLSNITT